MLAYPLAHVAFRWRDIHTHNRRRLGVAVLLPVLMLAAVENPALATMAILAAVLAVLATYEAVHSCDVASAFAAGC